MNSEDTKLRNVLRAARPSPSLPPRFQESVWRRIEDSEASVKSDSWLDALAALILRPKFAYTVAALLVLAGASLGAYRGAQVAKQDAQAQYLTAVVPPTLR
jgi:hypothetical protein